MAAEAIHPEQLETASTSGDFSLSPQEVAKGERAANSYLSSLKPGEPQRVAEEALDTLAAVISGGICDASSFPWHQVQPYHGALAFTILKEKGAPAHIEAMRCRADDTRKYQPVPEAYPPKQVAKIKSSFKGVLSQCQSLGFISDEARDLAVSASASTAAAKANGSNGKGHKKPQDDRELARTEVLALQAACRLDDSAAGNRDGLMISLAYHGALKTVDLIGLTIDHIQFDSRTQQSGVLFKPAQAKRARRVPFSNEEMIALEDWLMVRGNEPGALFCALGRGDKVEIKRMTAAEVREICDRRALEAGVQPFAPNDLAKSSPLASGASKKARKKAATAAPTEEDDALENESVLFGDEPEVDDSARRISFPYHVRLGP